MTWEVHAAESNVLAARAVDVVTRCGKSCLVQAVQQEE
jgi:hypothetical protein